MNAIITNELIERVALHSGLEALKQDHALITQFTQGCVNTGLESLDYPVGNLITSGLAAKYPEHFKVSDGLEGLTALVDTLKKGIDGLKKVIRGKKGVIKTTSPEVIKKIKATYANQTWADEEKYNFGKVKVPTLAKLVAGDSVEEVVSSATKIVDEIVKAVDKTIKETGAYYKKALEYTNKLKKMDEENDAYKALLADLVKALPELPGKAIDRELPKIIVASGEGDYPIVGKAKMVELGEALLTLINKSVKLEDDVYDAFQAYGLDENVVTDLYPEGSDEVFNRLYWEALCDPLLRQSEEALKQILAICQALEAWAIASIK